MRDQTKKQVTFSQIILMTEYYYREIGMLKQMFWRYNLVL